MKWKMLLEWAVPPLVLIGCAPVAQHYVFESDSPLHGKRIGVFFDRKLAGGVDGIDDFNLNEYLSAVAAGLGKNSNLTFVDLTHNHAPVQEVKTFTAKKIGFLGDTTAIAYKMPDKAALAGVIDSLDYVLVLDHLSFSGGVQVHNSDGGIPGATPKIPGIVSVPGAFVPAQIPIGGAHSGLSVGLSLGPREWDGGYQEGTYLDYILWDFRKETAVGYNRADMKKEEKFGSDTTSFGQDGEQMSQVILGKLKTELRFDQNNPAAGGALMRPRNIRNK